MDNERRFGRGLQVAPEVESATTADAAQVELTADNTSAADTLANDGPLAAGVIYQGSIDKQGLFGV